MLSDHQIQELAISSSLITPFSEDRLQPASYDLTMGNTVAVLHKEVPYVFAVGTDTPNYVYSTLEGGASWVLPPGKLVLLQTAETLRLPPSLAGRFEGKSSLGRIGLMTHVSSGFIDPGFHGVLTLEVYNCGTLSLELTPGIRIGQVAFYELDAPPVHVYGDAGIGSHYQGADRVQGGRFN